MAFKTCSLNLLRKSARNETKLKKTLFTERNEKSKDFFFFHFFLCNFMKMVVTGPKKGTKKKTVKTFVNLPEHLSIEARPNTSLLETLAAH